MHRRSCANKGVESIGNDWMTGFLRAEVKRSRRMRVNCLGVVNESYDTAIKVKEGNEIKEMSGGGGRGRGEGREGEKLWQGGVKNRS